MLITWTFCTYWIELKQKAEGGIQKCEEFGDQLDFFMLSMDIICRLHCKRVFFFQSCNQTKIIRMFYKEKTIPKIWKLH